jgi:hypothetical protein
MPKQACLDLWGDRLDAVWRRLPQPARRAVVEQYARLIARAAHTPKNKQGVVKR